MTANEYNVIKSNPDATANSAKLQNDVKPSNEQAKQRKEYMTDAEMLENTKQKKKSVKLSSFFASMAALLVLGGAVLSGGNGNAVAQIDSAWASETEIGYTVTVEEGEELEIVVYNNFTNRTQKLEVGENIGVFENLQPRMEYTVAIKDDGEIVAKQKIKTK